MMTDVLVYWRDYKQNWIRQHAGERAWYWHSNSKVLGELQPGDCLWLVTSGENVQAESTQAGFLGAIWKVKEVLENPGDDPAYPKDDYRYRIVADSAESFRLDDPVVVDHLLRPEGRDRGASIGRVLQGPRKLSGEKVRLLRAAAGPELALKWLIGNRA
jgi:hypothetical protein